MLRPRACRKAPKTDCKHSTPTLPIASSQNSLSAGRERQICCKTCEIKWNDPKSDGLAAKAIAITDQDASVGGHRLFIAGATSGATIAVAQRAPAPTHACIFCVPCNSICKWSTHTPDSGSIRGQLLRGFCVSSWAFLASRTEKAARHWNFRAKGRSHAGRSTCNNGDSTGILGGNGSRHGL